MKNAPAQIDVPVRETQRVRLDLEVGKAAKLHAISKRTKNSMASIIELCIANLK